MLNFKHCGLFHAAVINTSYTRSRGSWTYAIVAMNTDLLSCTWRTHSMCFLRFYVLEIF